LTQFLDRRAAMRPPVLVDYREPWCKANEGAPLVRLTGRALPFIF